VKTSHFMMSVLLFAVLGMLAGAAQDQRNSTSGEDTEAQDSMPPKGQLSAADREFVRKASEGGKAEVELGELATRKASSDAVKKFGQRMVDDHTKANEQLETLAGKEGVTPPTKPDAQQRREKGRLEKLSGGEFDREYMRLMVEDHTKDVDEFERESKDASDPGLRAFAADTLPTLKEHLSLAKSTAESAHTQTSAK
jgi:putative membrane protein